VNKWARNYSLCAAAFGLLTVPSGLALAHRSFVEASQEDECLPDLFGPPLVYASQAFKELSPYRRGFHHVFALSAGHPPCLTLAMKQRLRVISSD
jgi:hypothetical protein